MWITRRVVKLRFLAMEMPRVTRVGRLYRASGIVEGGAGVDTWSSVGTLPAGLVLDPATGIISGRPLRRGRYVLYIAVKDELGAARSMKISITVPPLRVPHSALARTAAATVPSDPELFPTASPSR